MTDFERDMITISDLTVTVRGTDRVLIRDLSLDVPQTHITGVIGPSGAGKSTLLKCINRLIDFMPTLEVRGTILIDGVDVRDPSIDPDDLRRRVGIVFQQPVTFHGSIRRNVTFAARKLDIVTRHNEDEVLESSLRAANLWDEVKDRLAQPAITLSVGQQQRLAIARSLAGNPEVLLMDEPTSALDARSTMSIEQTMVSLSNTKTVILVTHHLQQARRLADWIACLCPKDGSGTMVESGRCDVVFDKPAHEETRRLIGVG